MKRNTSNWSNFGMLLRRAGLTASAGLSCLHIFTEQRKILRNMLHIINNYFHFHYYHRLDYIIVHPPLLDGSSVAAAVGYYIAVAWKWAELPILLPARRYASAGLSDSNVSVCLSVTRRYCVKTKKASVVISSPSGSPKALVFWRQISSQNSKGLKEGWGWKIQRFYSFMRQYLENGNRYGKSYY